MTVQAALGRKLELQKNGVTVCGIRNLTKTDNNGPVDISNNCSDGFREILSEAGEQSLDVSFDGLIKDSMFRDIQNNPATSKLITDLAIVYPNGAKIEVDFYMASYEEGAPYNDAITFSVSLQSSGVPVYTAAP